MYYLKVVNIEKYLNPFFCLSYMGTTMHFPGKPNIEKIVGVDEIMVCIQPLVLYNRAKGYESYCTGFDQLEMWFGDVLTNTVSIGTDSKNTISIGRLIEGNKLIRDDCISERDLELIGDYHGEIYFDDNGRLMYTHLAEDPKKTTKLINKCDQGYMCDKGVRIKMPKSVLVCSPEDAKAPKYPMAELEKDGLVYKIEKLFCPSIHLGTKGENGDSRIRLDLQYRLLGKKH